MRLLDDETAGGPGDDQVDLLTDVSLEFFTASPSAIGPFGASVLRWKVAGVKPGVRILLDNSQVPAASQRIVAPQATHVYRLAAAAGPARKALGAATVSVDVSSCADGEVFGAFAFMRNLLKKAIDNEPTTYWSAFGPDKLWITEIDGQIRFHMLFRKRLDNAPDLWVDLYGAFDLAVADGRFAAVNASAKGSARFPRWFWFLSGIIGGLALALNNADEKATDQARAFIDRLVDLLNFLRIPTPGKVLRQARVTRRDGEPEVTYVECDDTELQLFADALSASVDG